MISKASSLRQNGGLAEWLCSGLQIRVHQFDSGIRLHFARVVELVDTRDLKSLAEKRAGSSPAPGTISTTISWEVKSKALMKRL